MTTIAFTALMGLFAFTGNGTLPIATGTPDTLISASSEQPQTDIPELSVLATAYNPVSGQTNSDPLITASGLPSNPEIVAARSRDLAETLPFGTIIAIETPADPNKGCGFDQVSHLVGYRVILDVMHARKHEQIDIMLNTDDYVSLAGRERNPAEVLGVCTHVAIRVVGRIDMNNVPQTQSELARLVEGEKLAQK